MKITCTACWKGKQDLTEDNVWGNCDQCGLPGPKPPDYEWPEGSGNWVTYYVNHGNTWQSMNRSREGESRWTEEGRYVNESGQIVYEWPPKGRFAELWKRVHETFPDEEKEDVLALLRVWSDENSTLVAYRETWEDEWHDVTPNWADPEAWGYKNDEDM